MEPSCEEPMPPRERGGPGETVTWEVKRVGSGAEGRQVIAAVLAAMMRQGYSPVAARRVGRGLAQAVASALGCSRQGDGTGRASVYYQVGAEYLLAEVDGRPPRPGPRSVQGPHGRGMLRPPEEGGAPWTRSYTWMRYRRWDDHFSLCAYLTVP
jgi:hypothetical protein